MLPRHFEVKLPFAVEGMHFWYDGNRRSTLGLPAEKQGNALSGGFRVRNSSFATDGQPTPVTLHPLVTATEEHRAGSYDKRLGGLRVGAHSKRHPWCPGADMSRKLLKLGWAVCCTHSFT